VEDGLVTLILEELRDKLKYLHNSLFDIPRLYRRFGVLLDDKGIHDTMIASRVGQRGSGRGTRARSSRRRTAWRIA
jgi:hypothetical protein